MLLHTLVGKVHGYTILAVAVKGGGVITILIE